MKRFPPRATRSTRAFTLVEIMIVVLIIGILLAIAVPNFVRSRQSSRVQTVVANLKQIESAKEQWAMETRANSTATPTQAQLVPNFLKKWPDGPVGVPTDYVARRLDLAPTFKGRTAEQFQNPATRAASVTAAGL